MRPKTQVVLAKAWNKADIADAVNGKMIEYANRGFRSLGLARSEVRRPAFLASAAAAPQHRRAARFFPARAWASPCVA